MRKRICFIILVVGLLALPARTLSLEKQDNIAVKYEENIFCNKISDNILENLSGGAELHINFSNYLRETKIILWDEVRRAQVTSFESFDGRGNLSQSMLSASFVK